MTQTPTNPLDFRSIPDGQEIVIRNTTAKMERTFLPIGSTIGKYRVIDEIDRGGMAVVYKALQLDLDREVALKVIPATISINPRLLERFLAEAHAVSRLNHPNIVTIHEISTENNVYFIAMDFIPGRNLSRFLVEMKPKLVDVLDIVSQLADALAYAHRQKIIHRDLKLNNVIMKDDRAPVLIDFGLAKALEEAESAPITRTGELVGSPAYMAPERILGAAVDQRSDICSLGIMLYEMLTFKNPYLDQRSVHQTTLNVIEANPVPPRKLVPWLPTEVEAITLKAMQGDVSRRYHTMEELHDDIERYRRGEYVQAQPPTVTSRLRHLVRRRWPYLLLIALTLTFAALLVLTVYLQSEKGRSHWQLMYDERFGDRAMSALWTHSPRLGADSTEGRWRTVNGALEVSPSSQPTWIRFERQFTRDMRVEVDISARNENLRDVGVFLYGSEPDSGYRFCLYRGVNAMHGIVAPGSRLLMSHYDPLTFKPARQHHVEIDRHDHALSMRIDGLVVARIWDHFPALGRNRQSMGFFSLGDGARFDNLRVSQLATPKSPGPAMVADRFWERGEFADALDEYSNLAVDVPHDETGRYVHLRIADCLIRLGRCQEAIDRMQRTPALRFGNDEELAEEAYLQAIASRRLGNLERSEQEFAAVCERYPATAVSNSAAAALAGQIEQLVAGGETDSACSLLSSLAPRLPRCHDMLGRIHLMAFDTMMAGEMIAPAIAECKRMLGLYNDDAAVAARVNLALAYATLCKRDIKPGVDLLNRCVAMQTNTEGVWEAWMLLASVYEHDHEYRDAFTICRKVYREGPQGSPLRWMARVKMGELAPKAGCDESPASIFKDVIEAAHPFALPRGIASLYLGRMGETLFTDLWHSYFPDDWYFLYYLAHRALNDGDRVVAQIYLQQLLQSLRPTSWEYLCIYQTVTDLNRQ